VITTTVDASGLDDLSKKLSGAAGGGISPDSLLREIAVSMVGVIQERIHTDGKKADGSNIGTYSDGYLKQRIKAKNFSDPKVVLFYTGDMQNDWKIIPLSDTEYGLGYDNSLNANKADWAEERFGKIFALSDQELNDVRTIVQAYLDKVFA
jgi:hypothetical protein